MNRLFQFFRIQKIAMRPGNLQEGEDGKKVYTKRGAPEILKEADRALGSAPHISNPITPILIHGIRPLEVLDWLIQQFPKAKDKRGKTPHPDTNIMLAGVIGYPLSPAEVWANKREQEIYLCWEAMFLKFLLKKWGHLLVSVVRHIDESYIHLHFYVIPDFLAGQSNLHSIDPALVAAGRAAPPNAPEGIAWKMGKSAMATAMRDLLNEAYKEVSAKFGHERVGPGLIRLSPKEKQRERQRQQAAKLAEEEEQERRFAEIGRASCRERV